MAVKKKPYWIVLLLFFASCATIASFDFNQLYGPPEPRSRVVPQVAKNHVDFWQDVKPVIDKRCVVCHGCYDAPCQLKMSSIEGIVRGISDQNVYDLSRLKEAPTTRLFGEGYDLQQWRDHGFSAVVNERADTPEANRKASLLYQVLALKERSGPPENKILSNDDYDFRLNRQQTCPKDDEFSRYAHDNPKAGMPYGLPQLSSDEQTAIQQWVEEGATYTARAPLNAEYMAQIKYWESYFNQDSLKMQLASRYIYEHLYPANLYFADIETAARPAYFFKIVRSKTPPGEPIELIATRRPYDDPGVERVYYRLRVNPQTIVSKIHMPYALGKKRHELWTSLFDRADYQVDTLPSYNLESSSNPFITFAQMPIASRYRFMLEEARYTIMGYIRGPVCRGQVALSVINDNFWVFFVNPEALKGGLTKNILSHDDQAFDLPAGDDPSVLGVVADWFHFSSLQQSVLEAKDKYIYQQLKGDRAVTLDLIWDGDGHNENASLTVFRHDDSAMVNKGMLGDPPKTAWVIDYSLLERIHYLLVAGYDVYGNAAHQVLTRKYMDFLRMEGESNFLFLLPAKQRKQELDYWYRDAEERVVKYMSSPGFDKLEPNIDYKTDNPKQELYAMLEDKLKNVMPQRHRLSSIADKALAKAMESISQLPSLAVIQMPQMAVLQVVDGDSRQYFSLLRNNAHLNISSMFDEQDFRLKYEDKEVAIPGIMGSYPNVFYRVERKHLADFIHQLFAVHDEASYESFIDVYGVRRTSDDFWPFSDRLHDDYMDFNPLEAGVLDYSRLENR